MEMNSNLGQKSVSNGAVGKMEVDSCALCGSKSVCKCERCGDFYCSPQCQREDWPKHRFICFPMPHLVNASNWCPQKENGVAEHKVPFLQSKSPNKNDHKEKKQTASKDIEGTKIPTSDHKEKKQIASKGIEGTKIPTSDHKEKKQIASKGIEDTKIPTSESCVILTGFKSSNRCYIRSTNPSDEENYKRILKEVDDFGKTASGLTSKPKSYSYALALREGKWCRVQIAGYDINKQFRVQFIDYGDFGKRYQKDLRQISHQLIKLPYLVHMVQLKDVKVVSMASQLLESLFKYTNQEYKVVFEKEDGMGGNAKLFNWKNKNLLNTDIVQLCAKHNNSRKCMEADIASNVSSTSNEAVNKNDLEKPTSSKNLNQRNGHINNANSPKNVKIENKNEKGSSPESSTVSKRKIITKPYQIQTHKPCLEPPFEISPLNENDRDCKVIITDDSFVEVGYIGCLLQNYCANLKEVVAFLKQYRGVNDQPYQPKLYEYCLAEFENEWYRAKVMQNIADDKYRVTYIDFTNEMELTSKSIRRYPMSLTVPCHTTFCAIDGLPEDLSDQLIDFLKSECTTFTELHIDNVRIVENVCYIKSKQLLKKLHDNKLI